MADLTDDERTDPLGLFNTARSYWRSAEHLNANAALLKVTHPHAPVTFLYCHAIELYLKAYLWAAGSSIPDLKKIGHRVARLAEAVAATGLKLDPEAAGILSHIDDAEVAIEARYIVTGFKHQPTNEALADVAEYLDQGFAAFLIDRGLPVRQEKFERPRPANELRKDTTEVLLHLFRTESDREHNASVMVGALRMDRNALTYHLDQLLALRLIQKGVGSEYWITAEGRRYVMERDRGAVELPQPDVAGRGVAPQDVGLAVAVEVADAVDHPVARDAILDVGGERDRGRYLGIEVRMTRSRSPSRSTCERSAHELRLRLSRRFTPITAILGSYPFSQCFGYS